MSVKAGDKWGEHLCAAGESCSLVSLMWDFIFCLTLRDFTLQLALALTSWGTPVGNFSTDTMPSSILLSKWLWTVKAKHHHLLKQFNLEGSYHLWESKSLEGLDATGHREGTVLKPVSLLLHQGCCRVQETAFGCLSLKGKKEAGHQVSLQDLQPRYCVTVKRFQLIGLGNWPFSFFPPHPKYSSLCLGEGSGVTLLYLLNLAPWG